MADEQLKQQVDQYVEEVWENVVEDIRSLVKIESVEDLEAAEPGKPFGPKANEALVTAEGIASRLGLEVTDLDGYIGFGDVPGKSDTYIATIAHTDIVPLGLGWTFPALDVTRKDGYLIGRGVLDDKGPFVLSLYAANFFRRQVEETGEKLPYTLRCIIGNNEETGMGDVPYYLDRYPEPAFCFSPDADFPVICGEKGVYHGEFCSEPLACGRLVELDGGTVANAIPGLACALVKAEASELPCGEGITLEDAGEGLVRVSAHGKGGHASLPAGTVNAIGILARYLLGADGLCTPEQRRFLELQALLTEDTCGKATGIESADDKFGSLTCIAGTVRTKDGRITQTIDSRYPSSITSDAIEKALREVAEAHGATLEIQSATDPFLTDPDSPEVKTLVATYNELTGSDGHAFTIGGGTYARHFRRAAAFGPNDPSFEFPDWVGPEHGPDEGIAESQLKLALKIYIVGLVRLMGLAE